MPSYSNFINASSKFMITVCTLAILLVKLWLTKSVSHTLFSTFLNSSSHSELCTHCNNSFKPSYFTFILGSWGNESKTLKDISNVSKSFCSWINVCWRTYQFWLVSRSRGEIFWEISSSSILRFLFEVSSYSCSYFSISLLN